MPPDAEAVRKKLLGKKRQVEPVGLSSGSTLLNLACSGHPDFAYRAGGYYFYVGDSSSGKTWWTWSALAEACHSPAFGDYEIVFDNAENGSFMDIAHYFGKSTLRRTEVRVSPDLDSFYNHLGDRLADGKRVIYVLDSMDVLKPKSVLEKRKKNRKAEERGDKASGSYGTDKARMNSERMPEINAGLRDTGSILFVISQTRDNIGPAAMFKPKTRSGGNSLTFYAQLEMWTKFGGDVKNKVRLNGVDKELKVGMYSKVQIKKNRLTGKDRFVKISLYQATGIDDVGSQVDFLTDWGHWGESRKVIQAKEFDFSGKVEALVAKIESEGLEARLKEITARVWREVEEAGEVKRKRRYE